MAEDLAEGMAKQAPVRGVQAPAPGATAATTLTGRRVVDDKLAVLRSLRRTPPGPYRDEDLEILQRWHGYGHSDEGANVTDPLEQLHFGAQRRDGPGGVDAAALSGAAAP